MKIYKINSVYILIMTNQRKHVILAINNMMKNIIKKLKYNISATKLLKIYWMLKNHIYKKQKYNNYNWKLDVYSKILYYCVYYKILKNSKNDSKLYHIWIVPIKK